MKSVKLFLVASLGFVLMSNSGCNNQTAREEQRRTEANQSKLLETQPPVQLEWSLERENINNRTKRWNDPNKVSYIYLLSYGRVMAFYAIKGKVSSVNSQITNTEQVYYNGGGTVALPSPSEDGSYGTNGDAIFFFTTDGAYVEWNGEYMLCDQELQLTTPPAITVVRHEK